MLINFVCTGNTCRSAMAQSMMIAEIRSQGLWKVTTTSSGVSAFPGSKMSHYSIQALLDLNIEPHDHRAQLLDNDLFDRSDVIIAMTSQHKKYIEAKFGGSKVFTLNDLTGCGDISDPIASEMKYYARIASKLYDSIMKLPSLLNLVIKIPTT